MRLGVPRIPDFCSPRTLAENCLSLNHRRSNAVSHLTKWETAYNKCLFTFTGKKAVPVEELDGVKEASPLVIALSKLEKIVVNGEEDKEGLKLWLSQANLFSKEAKVFGKKLDVAIKATKKDLYPEIHQELKALRKRFEYIVAEIEEDVKVRSGETVRKQNDLSHKLDKEREKLRNKKKLDDNEVKAQTTFLNKSILLASFPQTGRKTLAKAALIIAKLEANPTPDSFNKYFNGNGIGRHLSQQFLNLSLASQAQDCPYGLKAEIKNIKHSDELLRAFGDGDKKVIDPQASPQAVLNRVAEFKLLVKSMKPYYIKATKYLMQNKI
jgi:hypothetical protein